MWRLNLFLHVNKQIHDRLRVHVKRRNSWGNGTTFDRLEHQEIWLVQACNGETEDILGLKSTLIGAEAAQLRSQQRAQGTLWGKRIL